MSDLQEQLEIGRQAGEFLKYLSEHPYFEGLLERVKLEHARLILDLPPEHKDLFAKYRHRMNAFADVLEFVRGDIYQAQEALKELNGEKDKGGLL